MSVKIICDGCGEVIDDIGYTCSDGNEEHMTHWCEECNIGSANQEFRVCVWCGEPMVDGMTNEGNGLGADFHCHEECFTDAMNARYPDGWRLSPMSDYGEGDYGGYYEELLDDGTWEDTGIFYTQWY